MDRPFHLHGFFFQVLEDNGQPVEPLRWEDTVNVRAPDSPAQVERYLARRAASL